jgi:hypothetical protein
MKTMQIQQTSDYGIFKSHGEQQTMKPSHIKRLQSSMGRNGFIQAKPIHCYRSGKFNVIIDGHHRLAAAQSLAIPVYFVVGDKREADLIADENYAVRKWDGLAFANMFASRGLYDYVQLIAYTHRGIPFKLAMAMLAGESTDSGNQGEKLRTGAFKIKTTKSADDLLMVIDRLAPIAPEVRSRCFVVAMAALLNLPEFCPRTFISKIETNPRMLVKCATREQMFDLIEDIYNFRSRDRTPLAFLAKTFLRERNFKKSLTK